MEIARGKKSLIDFGFRLPSAYDNRPLKFEEFYSHMHQVIYVSATPSPWEGAMRPKVEMLFNKSSVPPAFLDPVIEVRPATNQVDDSLDEIRIETEKRGAGSCYNTDEKTIGRLIKISE